MRITRLHAANVHGYLPIAIDFFPDLTFLTGLNGSGKTSALRLLMALLTPNMTELSAISFTTASVTVSFEESEVIVTCNKSGEGIELSTSSLVDKLTLSNADLELLATSSTRDESRSPLHHKVLTHVVFQSIKKLTVPMFLGLDRRFYAPASALDDSVDSRRREINARRMWAENPSLRGSAAAGLADVNMLLADCMQEIRASQETLDETLRRKLLTSAFDYKPGNVDFEKTPSRQELERYRERLTHIERAAEGLRLPVPELKTMLTGFFESLTGVVDTLERASEKQGVRKKDSTKGKGGKKIVDPKVKNHLMEWLFNKSQADRILQHLQLLDQYGSERAALREPIDRFVSLANDFLAQTKKQVAVVGPGVLKVRLENSDTLRPISALSSGERQLIVMLAHLSLNKNLTISGVFIVDEPELSLHIDWQEHFVDAIREANPNVQLIMATHSPAIILDRTDCCWSLS